MIKQKYFKIIYFVIISLLFFLYNQVNAAINLIVSPVKYEIDANTWTTIVKTAKIRNPTNKTIHIVMWKSDFVPNWKNWVPKFVRKSEMVYPDQQLASWIEISTWSFDLAPKETKQIKFSIKVPANATPGWHYWAIFFKNNNSEQSSWTKVWINVDYWVLILLNVKWKVIVDAKIKEPQIEVHSWNWPWLVKDYCPNWDYSSSYYDKTCSKQKQKKEDIDDKKNNQKNKNDKQSKNNKQKENNKTNNQKNKNNKKNKDFFEVDFKIPIENKWNTHIKPRWKIILKDENWNVIKNVWKKIITNKKWAIIWEKIVDYIPINDVWWVVIPWSSRDFHCEWKWFPYRDYDKNWNPVIKFWTPSEYYTRKNLWKNRVLMPWEKIAKRKVNKKIKADFVIKYKWEDWKDIEFNSAKEFPISYEEEYIDINYYVLIPLIIFILLIFLFIIIKRKNKTECRKCGKKIDKDMKICPYCWAKQKKKKKK